MYTLHNFAAKMLQGIRRTTKATAIQLMALHQAGDAANCEQPQFCPFSSSEQGRCAHSSAVLVCCASLQWEATALHAIQLKWNIH